MPEFVSVDDADFAFTTSIGIRYRATFGDGSGYFSPDWGFSRDVVVFSFQIEDRIQRIPIDPEVKPAIVSIVKQRCQRLPLSIIFFIYDSSDGKGRGRQRKFDSWYNEFGRDAFRKFDAEIPIGRISILASILIRLDHPALEEIAQNFNQIVLDSAAKPDDSYE